MAINSARLQALIQQGRQRAVELVQHPDQLAQLAADYGPIVVGSALAGVSVARSKPSSPTRRPRLAKAAKTAGVVAFAARLALQPVAGSIGLAFTVTRSQTNKLISVYVTSKSGRFLLATAITVATAVAERQILAWAAEQPRLQALEARGLAARLKANTTKAPAEPVAGDDLWTRAHTWAEKTD